MVNISKEKLDTKVLAHIQKQFDRAILDLKNSPAGIDYLHELLTPSERIMLAKRFAATLMLEQDIPWSTITKTLHISRSTLAAIVEKKEKGHLPSISRECKKQSTSSTTDFWSTVEVVLRGGIMPERGSGRWDGVNRLDKSK